MAQTILVHNIERKVEEVYPYFSSMEQFVSIHPVIYKCDALAENQYVLYERQMGFSFSYSVCIEQALHNKQVVYYSEIIKGVTLKLVFDFEDEGDNTRITETVTFTGPFFVKSMFLAFLTKMHIRLVDNIKIQRIR